MSVAYPSEFVPVNRETIKTASPVTGRTLIGLVNNLNHLAGWRRPRHVYMPGVRAETWGDSTDIGWPFNMKDRDETHAFPIITSPLTRHLDVVVYGASKASEGTVAPYVTVSLAELTGATLDVCVKWARDDGTLPGSDEMPVLRGGLKRVKPTSVTTGGLARDGLASGLTPSSPRMLYTGGKPGEMIRVYIETHGFWLISVSIFEYPEVTL